MICKNCQKETTDTSKFCKFCGSEISASNNKRKLSYVFLAVSLLFLALSTPFNDFGYLIGKLIQLIVLWVIILGIIPYLIWRFGVRSNKRKDFLIFIFSILFLLASFFRFAGSAFEGYIANMVLTDENVKEMVKNRNNN
jgi:cytochrome bd-type quinol oxidase subunit 2